MKYASNTKTERNMAIVNIRKNDKSLSLNDIAKIFQISKARVCQILLRYRRREYEYR